MQDEIDTGSSAGSASGPGQTADEPTIYEVAVVGYGPSGVTAANFLGQFGIRTVVFEREKEIYPRARAVTVDDYTLRLFQAVGLDAGLKADMDLRTVLRWKTYQGREFLRVEPTDAPFGQPPSSMIFQPALERVLRRGAERFADTVDIRFSQQVDAVEQDDDGVTLSVSDVGGSARRTVRARYVLACDGGSSRVREQLDLPLEGTSLPQTWVIIDAKVKKWWPERDLLTFWSDPDRPVVDIPLALGHHRWELPLRPGESREDLSSREQLWALLAPFGVTAEHVEILQHAFYTHHVLMATTWRHGRVLLVGDAAHMMPPWAGQGMQSGIRDAHSAAWKLRAVLRGQAPDGLLDAYQAERQPHVREMTKLAQVMGLMIAARNPLLVAARNNLLGGVQRLPRIGRAIREFRFKPQPRVTAGFLTGARGRRSGVGQMLPQPTVATASGVWSPLDDHLGDGFAVVGLDVDPRDVLSPAERAGWERLGARYVVIRSRREAPRNGTELIDFHDVLAPWFARARTQVVVLRPDRFVAASQPSGLAVPAVDGRLDATPVPGHPRASAPSPLSERTPS